MKEIGKLYHLEGDFGNMQQECDNLEISKMRLILKMGRGSSTPEGREREMKNSQGRLKKLKKAIEKGEFKGSIIDRAKSQHEIDTQIDQLDGEFQKTTRSEEISELERDGDQYSEGFGGDLLQVNEKLVLPVPQAPEWETKEKMKAPKRKGWQKKIPMLG